jgi:anti-sigma regulatory factor (Ser/Thr protein kinase)
MTSARSTTSELRLPADPQYIVVAKRAAAGFASLAGFDVEAVHDLVIAVAQACENAISCAWRAVGDDSGQLKITFRVDEGQRLEVSVQSSCQKARVERFAAARAAAEHRAALLAQQQQEATDLALRVMGLFVDDFNYRVDERSGALRVRLTKYRVS